MGACAGKPAHKASHYISGTVVGWDGMITVSPRARKEEEDDENENVIRDRTEGVSERDRRCCKGDMVARNEVMDSTGLRSKSSGGDNEPIGLMGGSICGVLNNSNSVEEETAIVAAFDNKKALKTRRCTSDGYPTNGELTLSSCVFG